jgi:thioredoxin-dependent peroxiredoxin
VSEVAEGQEAPDFELANQDGEPVRLSSLRGKRVVLYFYPRADTPGCTAQACAIRDRQSEFDDAGAVVLGVSPDPVKALRKFADKYGLPFTLLSDEDHAVAEAYGTWVHKPARGYMKARMGIERSTFVIDADGKIERVLRNVKAQEHDELVLSGLAA